jgi:DNA-binding SARP family transcriptional activator
VAGERRRTAVALLVSAFLVAAVAVATYLFDADLSGARPTYGSGIDRKTGDQIVRDFIADQDAAARALATGDRSQLEGYLTGNALVDVEQQIAGTQATPNTTVKVHVQALRVIQARDPNDPSVVIEVQEDGVQIQTSSPQNAPPTEQSVSFHGDYWMRQSGGRYLITDQTIQNLEPSPLPAIGLAALALLWVAAAGALYVRSRPGRPVPAATTTSVTRTAAIEALPAVAPSPPAPPPSRLAAELEVRTFDGLHLLHGGKDYVAELQQRPVTGFVWQRLLVGTIRDPAYAPSREELARQVSPAVDRATQLKRMRNLVQGLRDLPPVLKDRITVADQAMRFRLQGVEVDALKLVEAAKRAAATNTLAAGELDGAQRIFDQSAGLFLPDFEKVEAFATDNHPTCTDLIADLRRSLTEKRVSLGLVLSDTYAAHGRPAQATSVLEELAKGREQRKDIVDRLVAAYRSTGRDAEADALAARLA